MAKGLEDILNGKDKRLEGVKSSKTRKGSTGDNPGVDYALRDKDGREFVASHDTEEHDDRVGNDSANEAGSKIKKALSDPKNAKLRPKESVYEAAACNNTDAGVSCAAHGKAKCPGYDNKGGKKFLLGGKKLQEVLTKKEPAGKWIKDFETSDNPKFAGKSPAKRKEMALAAYYAKQRDESAELASESRAYYPSPKQVQNYMPRTNTTDYSKSGDPIIQTAVDKITRKTPESLKNTITARSNRITAALKPPVKEAKNYDDTEEEVSMVTTELRAIAAKSEELLQKMPDNMHIEPWVQAKVAMAKASISSIHDYILYRDVKEDLAMPMLEKIKKAVDKKKLKED